jgi:hypothetical protein
MPDDRVTAEAPTELPGEPVERKLEPKDAFFSIADRTGLRRDFCLASDDFPESLSANLELLLELVFFASVEFSVVEGATFSSRPSMPEFIFLLLLSVDMVLVPSDRRRP